MLKERRSRKSGVYWQCDPQELLLAVVGAAVTRARCALCRPLRHAGANADNLIGGLKPRNCTALQLRTTCCLVSTLMRANK